jgi:hypothetical protein
MRRREEQMADFPLRSVNFLEARSRLTSGLPMTYPRPKTPEVVNKRNHARRPQIF